MPGSALSALALAGAAIAPLPQSEPIEAPWRVATLPQQKLPVTVYKVQAVEGRIALQVQAQGSYGNLVQELEPTPAPARLRWAWQVEKPNPQTNLRSKAGDDAAIKVCLSFDMALEQVPFMERQLVRLARSRSGEALPAATLCWVWGGAEAKGELINNAYTGRLRYIVLRNAQDANSTWFEEDRDVTADFMRAFGREVKAVPPVVAVVVSGDADNTGAFSLAKMAGLRAVP
jgi:Protein of unknown function (DUF3047)